MAKGSFRFYPSDFLGGTSHFTVTEVGAYLLALLYQESHDYVPNDLAEIKRITRCGDEFEQIWKTVRPKFVIRTTLIDGEERQVLVNLKMHAVKYGKTKKEKKILPTKTLDTFEEFWKAFPSGRKKARGPARESWSKAIEKATPEKIIEAAKAYALSPEGRGQYVKMPSTWLNQECWDDDRHSWNPNARINGQRTFEGILGD